MGINLNDSSFDQKEVSVFNNGVAGAVENVTMSVQKKGSDDKDTAPDYKLVFTDKGGNTTNMGIWYADPNREGAIQKQGKLLKHLIHCYKGADFSFPEFSDEKDMLDKCMKLLKEAKTDGTKVRIMTNYGSPGYPSSYIGVRKFVPFIESMKVDSANSRLHETDIELYERPSADRDTASATSAVSADDDWS